MLFVCTGNVCRSPMAERLLVWMLGGGHGRTIERSNTGSVLMQRDLTSGHAGAAIDAGGRDVVVESAGVAALAGQGMDAASAEAIRDLGADADGHVARQLTDEMLDRAHLVLVAETSHRRAVLGRRPGLMGRTFTMVEFARLAASLDPAAMVDLDVDARVRLVAAQRGRVPAPVVGGDDIADPYRQSMDVASTCAAQIWMILPSLVELLQA